MLAVGEGPAVVVDVDFQHFAVEARLADVTAVSVFLLLDAD